MIKSFRHKGIEKFFRTGKTSGIQINHAKKIRRILTNLNVAEKPEDMRASGLDLHRLTGRQKTFWAVKVSGNWRITFRFDERNAELVNYEDYH